MTWKIPTMFEFLSFVIFALTVIKKIKRMPIKDNFKNHENFINQ